jgi:hypothetical protein
MSKKTIHDEARGRDIHDGKERALAKQRPTQLSLFQTFLPEDDKYSNTIEFYDAIPKYFTNKRQMAEMREGPEGREIYLPTLDREFKHQDITYILKIKPARAEDRHGNEVEYYPSEQEETASIMAPATPFCFCAMQKRLTFEITRHSGVWAIILSGRKWPTR